MIITIIFYETFVTSGGGFDWYYHEGHALEAFEKEKKKVIKNLDTQLFLAKCNVPFTMGNEEITKYIEETFDDSMLLDKSVISYPLSQEAWRDLLAERNQ